MTREEAIETIKVAIAEVEWEYPMDYAAAFDVALEALRGPEVVRCRECKYLNVINQPKLYAHCPKTNTVFLPFELDTRTHFCSLGEREDGD